MNRLQNRGTILFALVAGIALSIKADGAGQTAPQTFAATYRGVSTAIRFDISPPLSELAKLRLETPVEIEDERHDDPPSGLEGPLGPQDIDAVVQRDIVGREIPSTLQSFDGQSNNCGGCAPPDPNGAVGLTQYVQTVNSTYAVFDKLTGAVSVGPANINTLWAGFGGPCQTENAGDPVVLYDRFADRWILTQFTAAGPTYYNCVALSTSANAAGTYYRWAFTTGGNFPDYPKYGIWSDAYYISTREFTGGSTFAGVGAYALNRTQ